ncbi:MAG: hypothetical protein QXJ71_09345 [Pyrobaculum sp.]|uniref:hypothetical protein n=1 Tax=Pyrobaculum sp. TaxID=2004705 RepID=UPI003173FB0A
MKAIEEDAEFRYAVAGLLELGEVLAELNKLREDFNIFAKEGLRRCEENNKRWEENNKRWKENEKPSEENMRRWKEGRRRQAFNEFWWLRSALEEIREALGGGFEYYAAWVVSALLRERRGACSARKRGAARRRLQRGGPLLPRVPRGGGGLHFGGD